MTRIYFGIRIPPVTTNSPGPVNPDDQPDVPPRDLDDYTEESACIAMIDALRFNPLLDGNRTHSAPGSPEAGKQ